MAEAGRLCRICQKRKPKRYCPGVSDDICPICCATEREVTITCPLDCVYLRDWRLHGKLPEIDPRQFPNADIQVDEAFLTRNEPLLLLLAASVGGTALQGAGLVESAGVVDNDVRAALEGLVRTYRTLQSGLVYESRPDNPLAARVYDSVQETLADMREQLEEEGSRIRDSDVLGVLAFLQRLEIQHNNGRPKGRAFIDFLRAFFPPDEGAESPVDRATSLIRMP